MRECVCVKHYSRQRCDLCKNARRCMHTVALSRTRTFIRRCKHARIFIGPLCTLIHKLRAPHMHLVQTTFKQSNSTVHVAVSVEEETTLDMILVCRQPALWLVVGA